VELEKHFVKVTTNEGIGTDREYCHDDGCYYCGRTSAARYVGRGSHDGMDQTLQDGYLSAG
jgi:hypothetical protein